MHVERMRGPKNKSPKSTSFSSIPIEPGPQNLSFAFRTQEKMVEVAECMVALSLQSPEFDPSQHPLMGLTCAVRDTSIVDRALEALKKGVLEQRRSKLSPGQKSEMQDQDFKLVDLQDGLWGKEAREAEQREMMLIDRFHSRVEEIILPTVQLLCEDRGLNLATEGLDRCRNYSLVKGPGNQASSSTATNETLVTFVANNIEDGGKPIFSDGLRVHSLFLASFEARSYDGIDMRFPKLMLEGSEGRYLENLVMQSFFGTYAARSILQAAWSVQEAKNARFLIFFATPYYMLAELVTIDGKWHLLLDQVYTAVREDPTESADSDLEYRPFLALLLALFMDHKEGFKIEGPSEVIKDKVRAKVKELGGAYDPSKFSIRPLESQGN
ncbi:BZ3500_MvSof-1268-A1-R1_Chr5-3g08340 [Microbotryum saponariae]|uniref:BZ3500_MvSof-1268-A1-R1_Chr5-3g08340 protein n=1 Tax=Microbotryum saponariae TaxID=289078 RepID=A0A2X0MK50_9BASI|nr:BZ3500_MvSof-1268-A1-R1_Chr5-3g08340 [Microbotryum saponariae]SDA08448.1 BZ3501_MvSof-1269-A2-R1_Chr5-3g08068 [Microbotryum saponariae]